MTSRRGALILAAGASTRMGTPKALLAWHGSTLLEHALSVVHSLAIDEVVVVLGPATAHLQLNVRTALNASPESGRSESIRIGVGQLDPSVEAILIQSVDQPTSREVIESLFNAEAEVAVPTFGGRRGHPIVVSGALRGELLALSEGGEGLRRVVRSHVVTEIPVDDESVTWNLNDPSAYAAALAHE
jgi:molybdenum cofactor cytidylyltransferase